MKKKILKPIVIIGIILFLIGIGLLVFKVLTDDAVTPIKKSDWLNFTAGYLAFGGTVGLGALALWQNNKLNEVNKRFIKNQLIINGYSLIDKITECEIEYYIGYYYYNDVLFKVSPSLCRNDYKKGSICYWYSFSIYCSYKGILRPTEYKIDSLTIVLSIEKKLYLDFYNKSKEFRRLGFNNEKNKVIISFEVLVDYYDNDYITHLKDAFEREKIDLEMNISYKNAFNIISTGTISILLKKVNKVENDSNSILTNYYEVENYSLIDNKFDT